MRTPTIAELKGQFTLSDAASTARLKADAAEEAAAKAESAAAEAVKAAESIAKPPAADPREAPHFAMLANAERTALARINPRRNRWPELQALDERINDNDRAQAEVGTKLSELQARRLDADGLHQAALADWFAGGEQGARPVSEAVALDEEIVATHAEIAAYDVIRDRLFEERVAFVQKHRDRLVRDAEKPVEQRLARCLALVDELEQARAELVACRSTLVWAQLYPSETLTEDPPYSNAIAGARLRVQQRHLPGITAQLPVANVFALLRDDAQHCATVATVAQAAAIDGVTRAVLTGTEALWSSSDEARELQSREKREALERFRQEWGYDPPEYGGV